MPVVIILSSGCAGGSVVDVSQVRGYADPVAEGILEAMNADDYAGYSEHFDDAMKKALPEADFMQGNGLIKAKIGDYVSKEFWKVETQKQYTVVYYRARFTEETADVTVKVVFREIAGEMYVSGLWFDSPGLRR